MTLSTPLVAQNGAYPAIDLRALLKPYATGPLRATDLVVSQRGGGVNMSVDVSAGSVIIPASVASRGTYLCTSDAVENVAITAAPGAGSTRIDLIVARVYDTEYGDGSDEWTLEAVTGTPGPSPSEPSAPAGSVVLARVNVGSSVSAITNANIADRRGRALPVTYGTAVPAVGVAGQIIVGTGGALRTFDGSVWTLLPTAAMFATDGATVSSFAIPTSISSGGSVNLGSPGASVGVQVNFAGRAIGDGSPVLTCRCEVSFDGGSTWDVGSHSITSGVSSSPSTLVASTHSATGTATGSVQARVMFSRQGGTSSTVSGQLSAQMVPG